jgi:hypothetical protein
MPEMAILAPVVIAGQPHPRLATPRYVRTHLIRIGRTKFYALVKAGKILMVNLGVGHPLVDVASVERLIANNRAQ